jgi:hypothetical protein
MHSLSYANLLNPRRKTGYTLCILGLLVGGMGLWLAPACGGEPRVFDNPPAFVSPVPPAYYEAQDLTAPSVRKLRQRVDKILAEAGNPRDEVGKVKALCNWVAENLRHPGFNVTYKKRTHDLEYDKMAHDPVATIEYTEKFLPLDPATWPSPECSQQADVLVGLLNTIGLHGRIICIKGHGTVEYFSPTLRKWVYVDPTFNEMYVTKTRPDLYCSTLEMRCLTLGGCVSLLQPVKCGPIPGRDYLQLYPTGFGDLFAAKMWHATFDMKEKTNTKPNLIVFGSTDIAFFQPYPKTERVEDIDFPLGLVRVSRVAVEGGQVRVALENCIPHFSCYERQAADGWKRLAAATDSWPAGGQPSEVAYRGVDNAGFSSPPVRVVAP